MPNELGHPSDDDRASTYEIRITGRLDPRWEAWFDGLTITIDNGDTLITGLVVDQAALHGLLRRIRDLGLPLVSVGPVESGNRPRWVGHAGVSDISVNAGAGGLPTSAPATTER